LNADECEAVGPDFDERRISLLFGRREVLFQLFLVSRIFKYISVRGALFIMPFIRRMYKNRRSPHRSELK
jgi:hypothetical protein